MTNESPLFQYFEAVRGRMLALKEPGEASWRETVERGMSEAHASADYVGLVQVVQTLGGLLEGEGNIAAALNELDQALKFCVEHPGATAWLRAMKASLLASQGQAEAAVEVASGAAEVAREHLEGTPRVKALALLEVVRMTTLQPPSPTLDAVLAEAMAQRRPLEQLFLATWQVAYLAARGFGREARPAIRTAAALSGGQGSLFHQADVTVFERWLAVIGAGGTAHEPSPTYYNPLAHARTACLEVWDAILQRNWGKAEMGVENIERRARRTGSAWGNTAAWGAMLEAARSGKPPAESEIVPPSLANLTLGTIGSAVAGAYAVALAGTKAHAEEWLEWVGRARKRGIESSLETPVSLRRVEGLLAVRSGRFQLAGKHLAAASRESARHGYSVAGALAALQAEELRMRQGFGASETAGFARAQLTGLGIDPVPHMYVVHQAYSAAGAQSNDVLTPREREVLRHLAQGLTYRETAEQLGTAWKTVQTQAHRIYGKLSSSNKTEAIAEARRLGILQG